MNYKGRLNSQKKHSKDSGMPIKISSKSKRNHGRTIMGRRRGKLTNLQRIMVDVRPT